MLGSTDRLQWSLSSGMAIFLMQSLHRQVCSLLRPCVCSFRVRLGSSLQIMTSHQCFFSGVPAKRQHPYRKEVLQLESRQTRKMTRSASLGSNLARSQCTAVSAPAKKEPVELEVLLCTAASPDTNCACFCKLCVFVYLWCGFSCWWQLTGH